MNSSQQVMADTEETPSQRQARIRREKREAKIKNTGQERLDKITRLSGRTPESMRHESPIATPPRSISPAISPNARTPATPTPPTNPEHMMMQEEYLRALMQKTQANDQAPQPGPNQDDPMLQMLNSMLSGMNNDPNGPQLPSFNPDDISKATGLPSFVTNMMMGQQAPPPSPAAQKEAQTWTVLHILFAVFAGVYMLNTVNNMTETFGMSPPAPATFQNPVSIFVLGEALLYSTRALTSTAAPVKTGFSYWIQTVRDIVRDGLVMVFLLGIYSWVQGSA